MWGNAIQPYVLRADGRMHSSDVRNVAFGYLDVKDPPAQQTSSSSAGAKERNAFVYESERHVVMLTSSRDCTTCISSLPVEVVDASGAVVAARDEIVAASMYVGHQAFVNFSLLHREGLDFLDRSPPTAETAERPRTPYLVTGSNDSHVLVWNIDTMRLEAVLDGHRSGVTCGDIIRIGGTNPSSTEWPKKEDLLNTRSYHGDIVTGDWAGTILLFSHRTGKVKAAYNKHENAIRGLVYLPDTSVIVSVSGDKTIHCWDFVRLAQEAANSLALAGPVCRVLQGHEDVVQCICYIGNNKPTDGAASAPFYSYVATGSNDCTVRLWAVESNLKDAHAVKTLLGHDSLVYGLCFSPCSGELMSASEDRTVRVWGRVNARAKDEGEEEKAAPKPSISQAVDIDDGFLSRFATVHIVPHPCVVWSVAACRVRRQSGGEGAEEVTEDLLLTGGSDHTVRLWTRNEDDFASIEKLELLEEAIAAQKVDIKLIGGASNRGGLFDMQAMPSVEQLHQFKGSAEGEKKFFKNEANEIEVYVWVSGRWDKIGVVVSENEPVSVSSTGQVIDPGTGASATSKKREKRMYKGRYYDYVFDVDINGRMLQLPYNAGDSVFEAAQNFINEHSILADFSEEASASASAVGVSQEHKEQIVSFIMDNIDQADVQKIPGLGHGNSHTDAPRTAVDSATFFQEESLWPTAELVEAFSAAPAQKKVTEFLSACAPDKVRDYATVMTDLQQQLGSLTASSAIDVSALASRLANLFALLPAEKKFPAMDALRYAVAQAPQQAAVFVAALLPHLSAAGPAVPPFDYMPSGDANALVFVRLLSNILPALMTAQTSGVAEAALVALRHFTGWAVTRVLPALAAANAATSESVRQALANYYLRNLSVLLRVVCSSGDCAGGEGRQAFAAFQVNLGTTSEAAQMLSRGFTAALQPMLSQHAATLASPLLRSAATAAAQIASEPSPPPSFPAAAAFKTDLKTVLLSVPEGHGLAGALH